MTHSNRSFRPITFLLSLCLVLVSVGLIFLLQPTPADALCPPGNYIVTSTADDGSFGTLRDGIASCKSTINFNLPNPSTIVVTGTLQVGLNKAIVGPLSSSVTIFGNNSIQMIQIYTGTTVSISNLTLAYGYAGPDGGGAVLSYGNLNLVSSNVNNNSQGVTANAAALANIGGGSMIVRNSVISNNGNIGAGGGIYNQSGNLIVMTTTFANNVAHDGGAIFNGGSLTVTGSTFYNNATISGDNSSSGGAISNYDASVIINSTFYSNTADFGGALYNHLGKMSVLNSTISGNRVPAGTAGSGIGNVSGGTVTITNTIIANNSNGANCFSANGGSIVDGGNNLENSSSCVFGGATGSNTNPRLGPLSNNGGATETLALLPGSPAIDAGNDTYCPSTDQRGAHRPIGPHCDIGAYEAGYLFLPLIIK